KKETLPSIPVTVGDRRVYEWKTGDKTAEAHTDTVTKSEKQADGSLHVTVSRSLPGSQAQEIVLSVSETAVSRISEEGRIHAQPVVLLKLPTALGLKWESDGHKYEVLAEE